VSLRINMNAAALTAHRMLSGSDQALGKSIERLSSGYRINSASDDPAALVISEKLRAQTSGLAQAIRNAGDAVNMVRTAEAALNEVSRVLRYMRDLAIHAANTGANDPASVQADQTQIITSIQAIDKIAEETQFGQKKLLDGTAGILASLSGDDVVSGNLSNPATTLSNNDAIHVNVTQAAEKASVASIDFGDNTDYMAENGTIYVNGAAVQFTTADTVAGVVDKINAVSNQTRVIASAADGVITLTSIEYGSAAKITATSETAYFFGATSVTDQGQDAQAQVTISGTTDVSDATWTAGEGLILRDSRGNRIVLKESAAITTGDLGEQFRISLGSMKFQVGAYADQVREISIPSIWTTGLGTGVKAGESVATIDVTTYDGANTAIKILDEAIREISTIRANLGAAQKNVFESSITSLNVARENIAASESAIRDTDMAEEMITLTRNQILQQAGVAMLAQANQAPQALLQLLK
jgi:flagellin